MNELKNLLIKLFKKGTITSEEKSKVRELFKNLDEDEKEEAKDDVDEASKLPEEGEGENEDDKKDDDKKVEDLAKSIADQISKGMKGFGISQKDLNKKKEISNKDFLGDMDVKIATVKRTGKDITMKASQVKLLSDWTKALLRKDYSGMESARTKLEPLVESSDSEGGYLVPVLLHSAIVELLEDEAVIRPRATTIDMTGMKTNQLNIDGIASKPIAQWSGENADKGTSSMTFNQIGLTPYTLAVIVPLSKQLRDDTPFNIVSLLAKAMASGVAKEEDKAFMTGNGTSKPTGIDNYTFTTIDAGGALTFDHIVSAFWRLPQAFRKNGYWIMNGRTIASLSNTKDSQNRPILLDSGIITEQGIPALKGRPVLEQNDVAASKIFFGDLSAYWIGVKQNLTIDIAEEATIRDVSLWERNLIAVRVEERVDGELTTTRSFVEISNTGVS